MPTRAETGEFHLPDLALIPEAPHSRQYVMGMLEGAMIIAIDERPTLRRIGNQTVRQLDIFLACVRNNAQRLIVDIVLSPHDIRIDMSIPIKTRAGNHYFAS